MTNWPTHARIPKSFAKNRPHIRVDPCCPETPKFVPLHRNKASDVLRVSLIHVNNKGCGAAGRREGLC